MRRATLAALPAACILAACGGGGSGGNGGSGQPPAPVANAAQGQYDGTTSTGLTVNGVVLDTGAFYVLYSQAGVIEGVIQGSGSANNGSFASSNALDFNLQGRGILPATVSASYVPKQSLNGTITYTAPPASTSFTSTFDVNYNTVPTLAAVAGNYTGSAAVNAASGPTGINIVSSAIAVSGPGTCKANGTIAPHAAGNVYDVSLTFTTAACSVAGKTMSGIAVPTPTGGLVLATLDSGRASGLIFSGSK